MSVLTSETCPVLEPFGLGFRQVLPVRPQAAQTTSEPEITTGDGADGEKIDSIWIKDEDEDEDEEKPPKK